MYSKVFLRLEPLGLEVIAESVRREGHEVRIIDLQVSSHDEYFKILDDWRPGVVAFSCNYLANIPEIVDLTKATRSKLPKSFIFTGGHSASFTAPDLLSHAEGTMDLVLKGEAEAAMPALLEAIEHDRDAIGEVPGAVTLDGEGPPPTFVESLDDLQPARDLLQKRRKYFIGHLDPAASVEFARGCPWDCSFCSAWTFYGRSYRVVSADKAVEDLARITAPGIFILDDVAFIQSKHGFEIGEGIARKGIRKEYYLETRGDILLRNRGVFEFWSDLGLKYMFLGIEAIDDEGLKQFRKRTSLDTNFKAIEFARSLGIEVAINIIADPEWDEKRFETLRQFCMEIPEIVSITVNTPYPGTETWHTEGRALTTRDYRLFDIQHAVVPTKLPLEDFYRELVKTQQVLNMKHLKWSAVRGASRIAVQRLVRGQTNFVKMIWKFNSVYDPERQIADHRREVRYEIGLPPVRTIELDRKKLYVHDMRGGKRKRTIDKNTEKFVDATRLR